jgi:hypothetical protein
LLGYCDKTWFLLLSCFGGNLKCILRNLNWITYPLGAPHHQQKHNF